MTILYFVWICYTVVSLSTILGLISLALLARWDQKKHDEKIRELLKARPNDSEN